MQFASLRQRIQALETPLFCDADVNTRVMSTTIHSCGNNTKLIGIAFTVEANGNIMAVLNAFSHTNNNNVLVINSGNSPWAMVGELFCLEAKRKELAGIVIDGYCRDIPGIKATKIAVFAKGSTPKKSANQNNWSYQVPIICGEVKINPGDIIFGDENGVIVIDPNELPILLQKAEADLVKEHEIKEKIAAGAALIELVK